MRKQTKQQSTALAMIIHALFYCAIVAAPRLLYFLVYSNSVVEFYQFSSGLWDVNLSCFALPEEFSFAVMNRAVCREKSYRSMQRLSSGSRYENLGELLPRKTSGSFVDTHKFSYVYMELTKRDSAITSAGTSRFVEQHVLECQRARDGVLPPPLVRTTTKKDFILRCMFTKRNISNVCFFSMYLHGHSFLHTCREIPFRLLAFPSLESSKLYESKDGKFLIDPLEFGG